MAKKMQTFNVQARLDLWVSTEIKAENLLDAVQEASTMQEKDFVTIDGDFIDGKLHITGVYE